MKTMPVWYQKTESFLLRYRLVLWIGLFVLILVSLYFALELARGKKAIPAALWTTYMFMP